MKSVKNDSIHQASEDGLDPADWEETRRLAHQMVDDAIDYYRNIKDQPAWEEMPESTKSKFSFDVPRNGSSLEEIYEDFKTDILPYPMKTAHPRFWGWYMGNGSFTGALADFLTSVINSNAGGGNQVAGVLETQVINWMKEIMDYPSHASGILLSGGSMANFVGLAMARHSKAGFDVRKQGLVNGETNMTVYASSEVHSCNQKSIELLGLGSNQLRLIPVQKDFTMNTSRLVQAITEDRKEGFKPICVIASAGTVNTGAIDDLEEIAEICESENMWFHVDGAIGAVAVLSKTGRKLLRGIEKSDSVAMDLHKWLHVPFEAGCTLVKNSKIHHDTFSLVPEYLAKNQRGLASGTNWYSEYGLQLSRRMRALKIWMSIRENGSIKFGDLIERNIHQAKYLASLVNKEHSLELMAPVVLDIVCFRFVHVALSPEQHHDLNREILARLHESGVAVPSYTTLHGIYCLRVAIANYRSTYADFDDLVRQVVAIGNNCVSR